MKQFFYEGHCTCNSYKCIVNKDRSDHNPLSLRTFCKVSLACNLYDLFDKDKKLIELLKDYSCYQLQSFDGFKRHNSVIRFHQPRYCTTCTNNGLIHPIDYVSTIPCRCNSCIKARSK